MMRRLFLVISIGLTLLVASIALAWVFLPQSTASVLLRLNNLSAGLTEKSVVTEIGEINYLEGGRGETIVLLHGIYSRKEHWVDVARELIPNYHVVALDLPGFGDNSVLDDNHYLLQNQMTNLGVVLDALKIERAHIGANSMGAHIAAMFAEARPDFVLSLAFIGSPLGVPTPVKSDMDRALAQGQIPLLVRTEADFHARNEWLFPAAPTVPGPLLLSWMRKEVSMAASNERIWTLVHNLSDVPNLLEIAPALEMETLIIWCNEDRIFHVSGAEKLDGALPDSKVVKLTGCGHVPMIDKPQETGEIYRNFLKEGLSARSNEGAVDHE